MREIIGSACFSLSGYSGGRHENRLVSRERQETVQEVVTEEDQRFSRDQGMEGEIFGSKQGFVHAQLYLTLMVEHQCQGCQSAGRHMKEL